MLISKILRNKLEYVKENGDKLIDLISSTFDFKKGGQFNAGLIRVSEEESMRPDLISSRIYTESSNWDILLKYNGISNPFSINSGEILVSPAFNSMDDFVVSPRAIIEKGKEKALNNENKLINPTSVKDKKRVEALKDRVSELVPPNVNTSGNKNVKIKDGKVIFGEDVTSINKDNESVPLSRARLIQQLVKSNGI
jgi:hypothetical protein